MTLFDKVAVVILSLGGPVAVSFQPIVNPLAHGRQGDFRDMVAKCRIVRDEDASFPFTDARASRWHS